MARDDSNLELVAFTKNSGPLTKRISLTDGGTLKSDNSQCPMATGRARRIRLASFADLGPLIQNLNPNEALALGALRDGLPDNVEIVTKDRLNGQAGVVARSQDFMFYRKDCPAIALLDYDTKAMPSDIAARIAEAGGFWQALIQVLPRLASAAHVSRKSTSTGLYRQDTGASFPGSAGMHVFILARDGSDVARFLKALHTRCWLAGFGWYSIGSAGQFLERSLIDRSVGGGERVVFEGPPVVIPPLMQDSSQRQAIFTDGDDVDTAEACPSLSAVEGVLLRKLQAEAKQRLEPERLKIRDRYLAEETDKLVKRTGIAKERAARIVEQQAKGTLHPDVLLFFDDADGETGGATVGDVLDDPARFEGLTLADPIEGLAAGRCKAKVFRSSVDGEPWINSFIHGGTVYRLRYDAESISTRIEQAADPIQTFLRLALWADLNEIETDKLVRGLAKTSAISISAIKKELKAAKASRARALAEGAEARRLAGGGEVESVIGEVNEEFALVLTDTAMIMKFEGQSFRLLQVKALDVWLANQQVPVGTRIMPLADYWLAHPQRRAYEGIEFEPSGGRPGYYNLWRGFAVEPRPGDCSRFLAHIRDNVARGVEAHFDWIIGWFAQIFQQPHVKLGTSMALRGSQGVGKTKVGETIGSLFTPANYALVSEPRYVTGNFNAHMASLLLLHADEAFWAGDKTAEGKLKDLVTGKHHFIEYKRVDQIRVKNFIRLLVTGNPKWVVPAGLDERRFAVWDVGEEHKQDIAYFAAIDDEMKNGGREALLHHLLNFDLSRVDLRVTPKTSALMAQKIESLDSMQEWWYDVLQRGELTGSWENGTYKCVRVTLYDNYIRRVNQTGARRKQVETALGMFLDKALGADLKKARAVYFLPPLATCRQRFAEMLNGELEWQDVKEEWMVEPM